MSVESLKVADLSIEVEEVGAPPGLRLAWRGKSNDRQPSRVLSPFFNQVLDYAAGKALPVEMRFHDLQHFNSSTITAVIELIEDAREKEVKLVLSYDGATRWQRVSFEALKVFRQPDGMLELRAD